MKVLMQRVTTRRRGPVADPPPALPPEVHRRIRTRRVLAALLPVLGVAVVVVVAILIARPGPLFELSRHPGRARTTGAAPEVRVRDGGVVIDVRNGNQPHRLHISRTERGWSVRDYPPGSEPPPSATEGHGLPSPYQPPPAPSSAKP